MQEDLKDRQEQIQRLKEENEKIMVGNTRFHLLKTSAASGPPLLYRKRAHTPLPIRRLVEFTVETVGIRLLRPQERAFSLWEKDQKIHANVLILCFTGPRTVTQSQVMQQETEQTIQKYKELAVQKECIQTEQIKQLGFEIQNLTDENGILKIELKKFEEASYEIEFLKEKCEKQQQEILSQKKALDQVIPCFHNSPESVWFLSEAASIFYIGVCSVLDYNSSLFVALHSKRLIACRWRA